MIAITITITVAIFNSIVDRSSTGLRALKRSRSEAMHSSNHQAFGLGYRVEGLGFAVGA